MKLFGLLQVLIVAFGLSACGYTGENTDFLSRKVNWFSYLNGDDLRAQCRHGGGNTFRFVYNGDYMWQTRSYEYNARTRKLDMWVRGDSVAQDEKSLVLVGAHTGLKNQMILDEEKGKLLQGLMSSDLRDIPLNVGQRFYSDDFYWSIMGCIDGQAHYNVIGWSDDHFSTLQSDNLLIALDVSDIEAATPDNTISAQRQLAQKNAEPFMIQLSEGHLVGF